jgi:hypothetical protein
MLREAKRPLLGTPGRQSSGAIWLVGARRSRAGRRLARFRLGDCCVRAAVGDEWGTAPLLATSESLVVQDAIPV